MDADALPPLELPSITIDLDAQPAAADAEDAIVLLFEQRPKPKSADNDDEEDDSIDWRSHDTIRTLYPHNHHDNLPLFVSHFPIEERSSFNADLLWRHVVPVRGKKGGAGGGGASGSGSPSGTGSKVQSPNSPSGGDFSRYQQPKKPASQATQKAGKGQVRGELGSAVAGTDKVNIAADEYTVDWYAVLKVDETASESELRTAFRRRCLETHPDKCQGSDKQFKKVQRAFEILGSAEARKQFDSSREFDDSIPPAGMEYDDGNSSAFYSMFGPVFMRNSRWSINPVTVSIGDDTTSVAEVRRFYDFWLGFRSWRDFSHVAEEELEEIHDTMAREEKRWYQRENERILANYKKAEVKRVRELVDRAMAADPRLRAEGKKVNLEKEAAKKAREETLMAAKLERERGEREAAEKEAAAKREAKEAEVRVRLAAKNAKVDLIATLKEKGLLDEEEDISKGIVDGQIRPANIEWIFSKTKDPVTLAESILGADGGNIVAEFNSLVLGMERTIGMTRYGEPCAKAKPAAPKEAPRPKQQSAALALSVPSKPAAAAAPLWGDEDVVLLSKAIAKYPRGTVDRWRRISTELRDKYSEEQVLHKIKELEHGGVASAKKAGEAMSSSMPASAAASAAAPAVEEEWTVKQQGQLEEGLRALKEYKEKDKFMKVSEFVTDKNARQCFDRFQHLRSLGAKPTTKPTPKK